MKQNKLIKCLALLAMMIGGASTAWAVDVTTSNFAANYTTAQAATSDTELVLDAGNYEASDLLFPATNKVTIKAAAGANVTFYGNFSINSANQTGSIVFEGIKIYPKAEYFIILANRYFTLGEITFKDCEITRKAADTPAYQRNILRIKGSKNGDNYSTINKIEFLNCLIHDWGVYGTKDGSNKDIKEDFLYLENENTKISNVIARNNTVYKLNGTGFIHLKGDNDNNINLRVTNNTFYKCGNNNPYLMNVEATYSGASCAYTIKDNIFSMNYSGENSARTCQIKGSEGDKDIDHNIMIAFNGAASNQLGKTIFGNDVTEVPFTDAANADFTLSVASNTKLQSEATTASTTAGAEFAGVLGDPRWAKFTLNESNNYTPVNLNGVKVALTRGITANKWSTIVLPFAMTNAQLKSAFGEHVAVAELTSGTNTELTFSTVTATAANKPYAIKVSSSDNYSGTATINGVTIVNATPTQTVTNWQFVGTYSNGTIAADNNYYFKSNKLYKAGGSGTTSIKPFRAYLHYTGSEPAPAPNFVIDGETTGIAHINADGQMTLEEGVVYNLAGQRVSQPTKGLYIVNGKKVIVK